MDTPEMPQKKPYVFNVEKGKKYFWCSCGRSNNQPLCDGSHKVTSFSPVLFVAEKDDTVYFCGCKRTATKPFCDGTHKTL